MAAEQLQNSDAVGKVSFSRAQCHFMWLIHNEQVTIEMLSTRLNLRRPPTDGVTVQFGHVYRLNVRRLSGVPSRSLFIEILNFQ